MCKDTFFSIPLLLDLVLVCFGLYIFSPSLFCCTFFFHPFLLFYGKCFFVM